MAITTYNACVHRALLYKNNNTFWIGLGRTSPWDNEYVPPAPEPTRIEIEEPIFFVATEFVSLVREVQSNSDIVVKGQRYAYVNDADAYTEQARFLYLRTRFTFFGENILYTYRQLGVVCNILPYPQYQNSTILFPNNINNFGRLDYLENRFPVQILGNKEEIIHIILEV